MITTSLLLFGFLAADPAGIQARIRADDIAWLKANAAEPGFLSTRDSRGNTPLLYAAGSGSAAAVEILLKQGADPNEANALGITPLLLAAPDPAKVKLLLAGGASLKVKSQIGQTPLVTAAATPRASESVKALLAAGANPDERGARGTTPLLAAVGSSCAATSARMLLAAGADARAVDGAGFGAAHAAVDCPVDLVAELIRKGANPNAQNTFGGAVKLGPVQLIGISPLMLASAHREPAMVKMLLDAGARVDLTDIRRMSALHYAVSSEEQDPEVVRLLLAKGADPKARDAAGLDAFAWARRFNRPEVLRLLGAPALPATPSAASGKGPGVEAAIALLERSNETFFRESGCGSCHHSVLLSFAGRYARNAGHRVNADLISARAARLRGMLGSLGTTLQQMVPPPGEIDTILYALLEARGLELPAAPELEAAARFVAARQAENGRFTLRGISRSPIEESDLHRTALAIWLLPQFSDAAARQKLVSDLQQATTWVGSQRARNLDEAAMKLLALRWGGASSAGIRQATRELLAMQSRDGSFPGRIGLAGEPYSTGLAIFALTEGGQVAAQNPAIVEAAEWLRQHQLPDASWWQASRAPKFQPYFESGFPHGHDQWISATATAWSVIGLSLAGR